MIRRSCIFSGCGQEGFGKRNVVAVSKRGASAGHRFAAAFRHGYVFRAVGAFLAMTLAHAADVVPRMLLLDGTVVGRDVVVVGERGVILRSADNGRSWQAGASPTRATLTGVSFAASTSPGQGWAVGHDALILATTDGGRVWQKQFQGENLQDSFLDVLALNAQRVIAVGAYGLYLTTDDGGKNWHRQKVSPDDYHFNRISRGPSGTLYLAGEHGTLLRSTDSGATWQSIAAPYEGSFYGVLPLDEHTLLAHGLRGHIFLSVNNGATWRLVPAPAQGLLAGGVKLKSNYIVLVGQDRSMLISRDYGQTFQSASTPRVATVAEVIELPNGSLLALGENGANSLPSP